MRPRLAALALVASLGMLPMAARSQTANTPPIQGFRAEPVFIWQAMPDGSYAKTSSTLEGERLAPQSLRVLGDTDQSYVQVTNGVTTVWVQTGDLRLPDEATGNLCSDMPLPAEGGGAETEGLASACGLKQ